MAEFEEKQKRMQEKAALQQKQRHMQMQQENSVKPASKILGLSFVWLSFL